MERRHVHIHVTGIVQGVGMRPFVYRAAREHRIAGWVLNAGDGVHIEAHGDRDDVDAFVRALRSDAPAASRIERVHVSDIAAPDGDDVPTDFRIVASDDATARTTLVSPDIATCEDCLRELFDPTDRRYHYPFINCTNCGPRFTIIRSLPYDRPATSMDRFPMCPACAAEYTDPGDRRFHAQPDACFACGPHITWRERTESDGPSEPVVGATRAESDAIIARCADLIADGGIVAIKGLGGFHLACDAENETAVSELRRRKRRSNKPLAIMVRRQDLGPLLPHDAAPSDEEMDVLAGSVRPIVLLRYPPQTVSPRLALSLTCGLPDIGVMLPYTPLQHLLLATCAQRGITALVMTSGNLSEEPIEVDDRAAWEHLVATGIADALLGNDRPILARYDDSVVRIVGGTTLPVRRARGYAPRPLPIPRTDAADIPCVLACGPEQKATVALTREDANDPYCIVSQHIGDIENAETLDAWHEARTRLEELFDLRPEALACDLHPTYLSSVWARREAETRGIPLIEVQHHHAHIASVIAEAICAGSLGADEPVIGFAFDGTGAGPDGTIWGGEVLIATLTDATRAAHLRTWRLPGGAASIRDARRCAHGLLHELGLLDHPGAVPLSAGMDERERAITETMLTRAINCPVTSSTGRLFDAVAALLGIAGTATYEGEPACRLEAAAWAQAPRNHEPGIDPQMRFDLTPDANGALIIDSEPVVRALLDGRAAQVDAGVLAWRFHDAVASMMVDAASAVREQTGIAAVALSGGVFLNRLLLEAAIERLSRAGFSILVPTGVPVNDGCIAYGQAVVARARLAASAGARA
ncbi:carbamoyltransferase HypF [Collinsella tanakaei]|uniref:carbamoyltransferase HypF n=1 Tax=Collinsella tanakaei TaxID=626935 RepID=UPI001F4165F1|nr:carbamoyltransferase HypF [Collinsella tanakaei]MCF2622098.1 carbamoyltransferase HypF [Collinsella tanakaei]